MDNDNDNQDYELDSISYDVSEADSVASEDTEDTDQHSNVTMTFKHRSHINSNSPNDVRSYSNNSFENGGDLGDMNNFLPRLGDPLPIVKEGKILEETRCDRNGHGHGHGHDGMEENADRAFEEYQQEEADFAKEMNTTKIAFSAYRSAVLHLVHHQKYKKEEGFLESNGGNDENNGDKEEDANLRMTILEENAKRMVEIKAKACFQAVDIANEFMERSFERKKGRGALFSELLNASQSSTEGEGDGDGDAAEEMVRSLEPVNDDAEDVNVGDVDVVEETIPAPAEAASTETANAIANGNAPEEMPKVEVKVTQPKLTPKPVQVQAKKKNPPKPKVKEVWKPQKFVRRKKNIKHADCILATLPVFQYKKNSKEDDAKKQMEESGDDIPASYGTSSWIRNMIHWRIQRRQYNINSFEKCACPDCSKGLNDVST